MSNITFCNTTNTNAAEVHYVCMYTTVHIMQFFLYP